MAWTIGHAQHIGARAEQQDRVLTMALDGDDAHLCVLADGMGGHPRGAEAAQAVIDAAADVRGRSLDDPFGVLEHLLQRAHARIRALSDGHSSPGSTCVAALLHGPEAFWAHVGDSRLYLFRAGNLIRSTEDHSLAVLVAKRGAGRRGASAVPVASNAVYRRLGSQEPPVPDYDAVEVASGDAVMLSSDGFWNSHPTHALARRLGAPVTDPHLLKTLVSEATHHGGRTADNATVLLARWHDA
jgi:serine/threonine protein phosphatase PrpC